MNPRAIEITVFKKSSGILSKTIAAAVDGSPVSDGSACRMSSGECETHSLCRAALKRSLILLTTWRQTRR